MHLGESRARNQSSGQDLASRWDLAMRGAREEEQREQRRLREGPRERGTKERGEPVDKEGTWLKW